MARQHIFAEGRYLGSRMIPTNRVFPGLDIRVNDSYVKFCARCGDIWCRFIHEAAEYTQLVCEPCPKHIVAGYWGGTLGCHPTWTHLPYLFADDWPPDAVAYEFNALLSTAERQLAKGT